MPRPLRAETRAVTNPKYKGIVVGMGKRSIRHATAFAANGRFEVAGMCDIADAPLSAAVAKLGNPQTSKNAAATAKRQARDYYDWIYANTPGRGEYRDCHRRWFFRGRHAECRGT